MIEALDGEFTFLKFLSILAFITTVGLFFCGIPICRQIWKRKDTSEISGAPFLMGVLGGTCWCVYGYLKKDQTVLYVTGAQIVLYAIYTVFYWFMTKNKLWISIKVALLLTICGSLVAMVHFFGHKVFHPLGFICMTLNTADFAAPLAGLRVVIRRRATSTLPLPLCIANFLVSSEWFLYGLLVWDFYLITPNGIGSLLAFAQLILFVVLPRKPNQRAPFLCVYDKLRVCCMENSLDLEAAAVVPVDKMAEKMVGVHRISRQRWSSRVITNVVGEVENVIQKVQLGDQFGYSNKLNKHNSEENGSTDSVTLTPEEERKEQLETNRIAPKCCQCKLDIVEELAPQNLDFSQSGKSLKLSAKHLQKLAANFGHNQEEDTTDDEELSEEKEEKEIQEKNGPKELIEEGGDQMINGEMVFPITIRDATQLLRLSRGLKKKQLQKRRMKGPLGFGCSLQQQHFKALRQKQHEKEQNDEVPIINEEEEDFFGLAAKKQIKRASSEPSLIIEQQRQQQHEHSVDNFGGQHFERL